MISRSSVLLLAACLPGLLAYSMYRERIPNGDHVPHPCKPNFLWHGVGHRISQGGGARNPFGEDFHANGEKWTEDLCRMDSDGDGKTNGQELGDPNCVWMEGETPEVTDDISHPGVCDPWNEADCVGKNSWLDCSRDEVFDCDYINDPDVLNITLRFPRTKVPARETTYVCFNFELPTDREYHLIATKPLIDNHNVMHHITLNACEGNVKLLSEPQECLMGSAGCTKTLGGWTLGMTGQCYDPIAGLPMGKGSPGIASMQFHWTNPHEVDTYYDSSALVLYYTPKLRRYNADSLVLGQAYLNIPPRQQSWVHRGTCTSDCTKKIFRGDVHVMNVLHHMHYLGMRQNVTLVRPGQAPMTLIDENPFRYDTPLQHEMDPYVTLKPGDELYTDCTFQSASRAKTTTYGEGSFDEMCFAFLLFYPAENVSNPVCAQWKDMDLCDMGTMCDSYTVFNSSHPDAQRMIRKLLESCDPAGSCRPECPAAVEEVLAENMCVRNMWDYVYETQLMRSNDPWMMKFNTALKSCDGERHHEVTTTPSSFRPTVRPDDSKGPKEHTDMDSNSMFMNVLKQLDTRPLLQNIVMNVNYNNYINNRADEDDHAENWH